MGLYVRVKEREKQSKSGRRHEEKGRNLFFAGIVCSIGAHIVRLRQTQMSLAANITITHIRKRMNTYVNSISA
jgi:hypothetical protein